MHRFYYNHEIPLDVFFVVISPDKKVTKSEGKGDVVALYSEEEIVGYNLFNAKSYISDLKDGAYLKEDEKTLEEVNKALSENGFIPLKKNETSGYRVACVKALEEHPLLAKANIVTLTILDKEVQTVSFYQNLKVGAKVVVKENGCLDREGVMFLSHVEKNIPIDVSICGSEELNLPKTDGAYLTDKKEGSDFFLD